MHVYLLRRLLMFFPIMLAVYTLVFVVMHATPGGPWDKTERPLPPAILKNLEEKIRSERSSMATVWQLLGWDRHSL